MSLTTTTSICLVLLSCVVSQWFLAPSIWGCVLHEATRSKRFRPDLVALVLCPHMFSFWWVAEGLSFYDCSVESLVLQGRLVFSWVRVCQLPRLFGTRSWHNDLKKRCDQNKHKQLKVASMIWLGYLRLVSSAFTLKGAIGLLFWSYSLPKKKQYRK